MYELRYNKIKLSKSISSKNKLAIRTPIIIVDEKHNSDRKNSFGYELNRKYKDVKCFKLRNSRLVHMYIKYLKSSFEKIYVNATSPTINKTELTATNPSKETDRHSRSSFILSATE